MFSISNNIGGRQQSLLEALLHSSSGLTVDELALTLNISRNAVAQHLANLDGMGLVTNTVQQSTGGRPSKLYKLSAAGGELFPRHYDLFANMLIQLLAEDVGESKLRSYMSQLGNLIAAKYQRQIKAKHTRTEQIEELVGIMTNLGYKAHTVNDDDGLTEIVAFNCVFHQLAAKCHAVCDLDTTLISSSLDGASVKHKECIVRGGNACRFSISK